MSARAAGDRQAAGPPDPLISLATRIFAIAGDIMSAFGNSQKLKTS
jgi:hypothetical protein